MHLTDQQIEKEERQTAAFRRDIGLSAIPPSEPQGACERSSLATCSLSVSLVEDVATLMTDCATQVTQWQAQWLVALAAELRAHAAAASKRQPEENVKDEPRP